MALSSVTWCGVVMTSSAAILDLSDVMLDGYDVSSWAADGASEAPTSVFWRSCCLCFFTAAVYHNGINQKRSGISNLGSERCWHLANGKDLIQLSPNGEESRIHKRIQIATTVIDISLGDGQGLHKIHRNSFITFLTKPFSSLAFGGRNNRINRGVYLVTVTRDYCFHSAMSGFKIRRRRHRT